MSMGNFETQDLCFAAVLQYFGSPIQGIEYGKDGRATFFFNSEQGCEQIKEAFWRCRLRVEPQAFFSALKVAKTRLYSK